MRRKAVAKFWKNEVQAWLGPGLVLKGTALLGTLTVTILLALLPQSLH